MKKARKNNILWISVALDLLLHMERFTALIMFSPDPHNNIQGSSAQQELWKNINWIYPKQDQPIRIKRSGSKEH